MPQATGWNCWSVLTRARSWTPWFCWVPSSSGCSVILWHKAWIFVFWLNKTWVCWITSSFLGKIIRESIKNIHSLKTFKSHPSSTSLRKSWAGQEWDGSSPRAGLGGIQGRDTLWTPTPALSSSSAIPLPTQSCSGKQQHKAAQMSPPSSISSPVLSSQLKAGRLANIDYK